MEYLLLGARLLLAAVFLVSSIGKLLDLGGAKSAMEGFGVPASISRPASWLLIAAELIVAVLLIPASTAWWGALGALLLLGAFIVGISYNMTKGNHPDCHCFGQFHSEPAGWPTLIRNGVLGAVALFVVLYGTDRWSFSHGNAGVSAVDWIRDLTTWETIVTILGIVALLALAGLAWLVVHLLGQNGRVLLRLDALEAQMEKVGQGVPAAAAGIAAPATQPAAAPTPAPAGLPVGSQAPAFKLEGIYGETMTLDALKAQGKPIMLLFTDPGCGPCNALLPDIAKWQKQHAGVLTVSLISSGTAEANRNKAAEHGITQVLLQPNRDVSTQYKAHGTPSAVIVTANGVIDSPIAAGSAAIPGNSSRRGLGLQHRRPRQLALLRQHPRNQLPPSQLLPSRSAITAQRLRPLPLRLPHQLSPRQRHSNQAVEHRPPTCHSPIWRATPSTSRISAARTRCFSSGTPVVGSVARWPMNLRSGKPTRRQMLRNCWSFRPALWKRMRRWDCAPRHSSIKVSLLAVRSGPAASPCCGSTRATSSRPASSCPAGPQ
ncbi:MAG: redoxin domain-containing protein [Thermomicrobiales bacterium]